MLAYAVRRGKLASVSRRLPRPRPGWALVRVRLAGICNTDLEILRGYHGFRGTLGHEFVGEVERVSARSPADAGWIGRRVVGEINIGCASLGRKSPCAFCRRGLVSHCLHRRVLGILGHDGAFAEYLTLPLANLHRVPISVTDEQAVFTEPLAAACEILDQVRVSEHREAAVLGDGKLAQLIARVLRAQKLPVTMFGRHEQKLSIARRAGVRTVRIAGEAVLPHFRKHYSLLIEATGSPNGFDMAQEMACARGIVVLKSTFHGSASVQTWPVVVKELTLIGSRCGPFAPALSLLHERVDPRPLISRVFPLREALLAIRFAAELGVMKVLLQP